MAEAMMSKICMLSSSSSIHHHQHEWVSIFPRQSSEFLSRKGFTSLKFRPLSIRPSSSSPSSTSNSDFGGRRFLVQGPDGIPMNGLTRSASSSYLSSLNAQCRSSLKGLFSCICGVPLGKKYEWKIPHATWRYFGFGISDSDVPGHVFFGRRSYVNATWRSFNIKENFAGPPHGNRLYSGDKLRRQTVVRSELVGTGALDVDYPLSEPHLGSKVRGIFFYAVTSVAAIILFMVMVVAHPFVLLLDRYRRKAQHFIAKIWALIAITPFVKVEFEGVENLPTSDTAAVYVSNHQSFLDIYTLLTLGRSFKFISKTSIFLIPIIGWAMFFMGTIPLKRMDSRSQLECLRRCMDLLKNGGSVFFFPEGTRSKDGKLGAFKKGAFTVAAKTKVPVVPITLLGTGNIMPTGQESILNPGTVRVIIHKPIEGSNAEALCNEARNIIADALIYHG